MRAESLFKIRRTIKSIFGATEENELIFSLAVEGSTGTDCVWCLRAHLPVRTSPQGSPLLLLTAVDFRQADRMALRGDLNGDRFTEDFARIIGDPQQLTIIPLATMGEERLFRSLLRLNSIKIQPTEWQRENVPLGNSSTSSPWLVTFIQPLYQDFHMFNPISHASDGGCAKCHKNADNLKLCGRCKAVSYCCVECQRAAWSQHKPLCSIKN